MFCSRKKHKMKFDDEAKRRSGRLAATIKIDENLVVKKVPKTKKEDNAIRKAITSNEFLSHVLKGTRLQNVIDTMYPVTIEEGEDVITEGEFGEFLYISYTGTYSIRKNNAELFTFKDVRVFGELSLLYNALRLASIKCISGGQVWKLDCNTFKALTVKNAIDEHQEMVNFLKNIPTLNSVSNDLLNEVANLFEVEFFPSNTNIVVEGEVGDKFYVIRAGTVTVSKQDVGQVDTLKKGKYFGELAILNEDVRQATIIADPPGVECLSLSSKQFIDHFGEVEEFVKIKNVHRTSPKGTVNIHGNLNLSEFNIVNTLGIGGYGRVELIQHKKMPKLVFALKYVRKQTISSIHGKEHIFNEKLLQLSCNSPFIVRLYRTYKDAKYVYFLLENCLGGDLWTLMRRKYTKGFTEPSVQFYAGCVLEALAYLHEHEIIYRDLKPENLVIDAQGYLKLTDFGFAKKLDRKGKTFTFVGTPEYIAPEIIKNEGHNKEADYWAYGVLIYELFTCTTPFKSKDISNMGTYKLILKGLDNVEFPKSIPSTGKHLIRQLCRMKGFERLGCKREGADGIRKHPWYNNFNWESLRQKKLLPPFKPELKSNTDTRYFEKFELDKCVPLSDLSGWDDNF